MPTDLSSSPVPLYHQIFTILRQRVVNGTYEPGGRLATEEELAAEFGVSRATIRQAVGELVRLGMISRRQGRGTFVPMDIPKQLGQRFRGSLADLIQETQRARTSTIHIERESLIPGLIAESLALDHRVATVIRRTRTIDGKVFAYTVNYLPRAIGDLLEEDDLRQDSLMATLERRGIRLAGATQSIHAQLADPNVSLQLETDFGAAVLFVERLLWGPRRRPVEVVQTWYRGDMYEYTVTLHVRERRNLTSQLA